MSEAQPRKTYTTDLSNEQWVIIEPIVSKDRRRSPRGRRREVCVREVVNSILYLNRTGCQWELLPHDLLPKSTMYDYFVKWRDDGTWNELLTALRTRIREQEGREATPSAACVDSQSVKTTEIGGKERGYDGATKNQRQEASFAGRHAGASPRHYGDRRQR